MKSYIVINISKNNLGMQPVVMKSKCTVHVTSYIEKPDIVKGLPRTLKLNEGETLRLQCHLSKKPERLDWLLNSTKLTPSSSLKLTSSPDGLQHTLEVPLCTPHDHSGTYQLNADDKLSICEVKVLPVAAQFKQRPPATLLYDCVREMEDGNDTLSIDCVVDKNAAQVRWFRGNAEIVPGEKYELIVEGPIRCLLVHDVTADDSGEYYCSLGSEYSKTVVEVIEARPAVIEPKAAVVYEAKYEKIDVYEGKGLVMGIDLDSAEQSQKCSWFKDKKPLDVQTAKDG